MKKLGKFWNDKELSVYEIDGIEVLPEYKKLKNGDFELINLIIL